MIYKIRRQLTTTAYRITGTGYTETIEAGESAVISHKEGGKYCVMTLAGLVVVDPVDLEPNPEARAK